MWLSLSLLTTLALTPGVEVHATSACPSSASIAAKLAPLLATGTSEADHALVETAPGEGASEVYLRLSRPDGSTLGERRLVLQGGCEEMADAVASVLAAWEAPPAPPVAATELRSSSARSAPAEPAPVPLWLGASGGLALVGGTAAIGSMELVAEPALSQLRARLAAATQTLRQRALDEQQLAWRRSHAELGLGWRAHGAGARSFWQVSADADVLLGWLSASGQGFFQDHSASALEYGAGAGLRAERRLGRWSLWLEARGVLWAQGQQAVLQGSSATVPLPRFDVSVSLGASGLAFR